MLPSVILLWNPDGSETMDYNMINLEVSCTTRLSQLSFHYQLFLVKLSELRDLVSIHLCIYVTMSA